VNELAITKGIAADCSIGCC